MSKRDLQTLLDKYVSDDDVGLDRLTFLRYVRERIMDDIESMTDLYEHWEMLSEEGRQEFMRLANLTRKEG